MAKMGLQFGLDKGQYCKRSFRWLFAIPNVTPDSGTGEGANVLPPEKSARPNLGFKEMNAQHLIEEVFYPAKPDWKPINLTLYDLKKGNHPVFEWIREHYKPQPGILYPPNANAFIKECTLTLYNGCGDSVEQWIFEDAWPQNANFQVLDMNDSGIVTCDLTLRYARAYVVDNPEFILDGDGPTPV